MGPWRKPPPTMTDPIEGASDEEKGTTEQLASVDRQPQHPHVSPEIERRIVRKLDLRFTSLVGFLFLLSYLDRSNIGNAETAGMQKDLNLSSQQYAWLLTIFYISYILFEFLVMMWKIVPPHIWGAFVVFGWGIIATLQAASTSWSGMMVCRFFLGAIEAGYGTGIPYLLSFFYLRHEVGLRIGLFVSAAPLANTFAGALAYGITSGHSKLANWRLLFLVEGIPTLLMVPVTFFCLPDSPEQAKYLTEEEKLVAKARGVRQAGSAHRVGGIQWKEVGLALADPKCWITALMYFSMNVSYSSLPVFLPTILSEMGFGPINGQGLTAPPYFLSFLLTIATAFIADRTQQRGIMIIILSCIGGIGYVLLATVESVGVRYFGVWLAAAGIFPAIANVLPWVTNNQGSDTRRGVGIALLNIIGQCGPLLGTNVFPSSDGPRYIRGFSICAAFIFFNALLALGLRTLLVYENKKLDQEYGPRSEVLTRRGTEKREGGEEASVSVGAEENYGPAFRYVL